MGLRKAWLAPLALAAALGGGCGKSTGTAPNAFTGPTPATHMYFPIATGVHAGACAQCHLPTYASFKQFDCLGCHSLAATQPVHPTVAGFTYDSASCYLCHADPATHPFDHQVTGTCASCHAAGAWYAVLPIPNFTHPDLGANPPDCATCHSTSGWGTVAAPTALVADPSQAVSIVALVPRFTGTSIASVSAVPESLSMPMNHASAQVTATGLLCADCHLTAAAGSFFPGRFHATLANHALAPPGACGDCHSTSAPTGFVGPAATNPVRSPSSGEMRHDAVAWSGGAPTATSIVTLDCVSCHVPPSATLQATWASTSGGGTPARFHASLAAAGKPQPGSCVDCHANGRPSGAVVSTALPAGLRFDHGSAAHGLDDCASCHAAPPTAPAWRGGRWHHAGDATPASCLPCHSGERPTSTTGWVAASWSASPFDYGATAYGTTHGDGQDCALCHSGPGTGGSWGGTHTWTGGTFTHGPSTISGTTCAACHQTQRPDRLMGQAAASTALGFDHAVSGTGDCIGCHSATVTAGRYVALYNASGTLPGGDWKGAAGYPGSALVFSPAQSVTVSTVTLARSGAGLVTGQTAGQASVPNAMLHTSAAVPSAVSPGAPGAAPDTTTCWHCHGDANGNVTTYVGGVFHASLDNFRATPGGAITPLPQPVAGCADCHGTTVPPAVALGTSDLVAMDHAAAFAPGSSIGGQPVSGVAVLECVVCHSPPPGSWGAGAFHPGIAAAVPADCVACHYPLMADAARADAASTPGYAMSHRSAQVPTQACSTCHASALPQAAGAASAPTPAAWRPGAFHPSVPAQPQACVDCHAVSEPAPGQPTQSTVSYALAAGGTSSNGGQWMNHGAATVVASDCAKCHASDARASGSAWSRSTAFHAVVASPGSCQGCHGVQNGNGTVAGTGNNLPVGLTSSSMVTSASLDPATGVAAGTLDQITHADVNVTSHDCAFCHRQVGPSTAPGVAGAEWAQASFHASFGASSPLVLNGTTGRCSSCHMNVRPGPGITAQDHSAMTSASGTQDCSACHSWPGTGTAASPNWLGATAMPQYIAVGGFAIPQPPAAAPTTQAGIANLPHPTLATGTTCAACHTNGIGGTGAIGYDHASALIAANCGSCHEAGSSLLGTPWNGATTQRAGLGDTRPYTLSTVTAIRGTNGGDCPITLPNHFYPVDCAECHVPSAGIDPTSVGTYYSAAWWFPHTTSKMSNPSTCNLCHVGQGCSSN